MGVGRKGGRGGNRTLSTNKSTNGEEKGAREADDDDAENKPGCGWPVGARATVLCYPERGITDRQMRASRA